MLTWTDQPYATMWAHLRFLSHEQNACRLLNNDLGGSRKLSVDPGILKIKAAQLSYCIVQAFEYYQAAESVTVYTSPLLYFYGMLSLAKGLIVANDPSKLLNDIKYHGLHHDKAARASSLDDQVAVVSGGVFDNFVEVVTGFRFPKGATFTLKDVLSISPELSNMYERYYPGKARCLYLSGTDVLSKNPYCVRVCPQVQTKEEAFARIPELATDFDVEAEKYHGQVIALRSKPSVNKPPPYLSAYRPVVGGKYLVGTLPFTINGTQSSRHMLPPTTDYIAMYILSDCVRYQQDLWGAVVEGKQTGILGLVDLFIAVSKRRFPNLILDELYGERFRYGSPAYFM